MPETKQPFTAEEQKIVNLLGESLIEYNKLHPWTHEEAEEFAEGIKKAQSVLMERVLKRDYPEHFA